MISYVLQTRNEIGYDLITGLNMENKNKQGTTLLGIVLLLSLLWIYSKLSQIEQHTKTIEGYADGMHTDIKFIADKIERKKVRNIFEYE